MNESLLLFLLKLFAITVEANKNVISGTARDIVSAYLKKEFSDNVKSFYLELFDSYLKEFHKEDSPKDIHEESGIILHDLDNATKVCQQINEELEQEQKVWLFLQLLEFISESDLITRNELELIKNIGRLFNIPEDEYRDCRNFILGTEKSIPQSERVLIVNNDENFQHKTVKHLYNKGISGKIFILWIESTNTFIFRYFGEKNLYNNGHIISIGKVYIFGVGSVIRSPRINSIYYSAVASKFIKSLDTAKIVFTAKDIEFKFRRSENGIYPFNFSGKSGELIGIMGGSGSGKSTLLNVLNGNLNLNGGQIAINGYDISKYQESLKGVIGYVPQDDFLIEELTVYDNLYYNAKLCFKDFSEKRIKELVENVLIDFDLVEARNLKVGNPVNKIISGGQRKRLNIGLELMREPSVLFVDEPTSGLSSIDSEKVMNLLKRQTIKGRLVICIIHQPSSVIYKLFDKMLIIDHGGRIIYNGNPIDAVVYFKNISHFVNPDESECLTCGHVSTEQILRIIEARKVDEYGKQIRQRKRSSKEWYKLYKENIEEKRGELKIPKKSKLPDNFFKTPGYFKQFRIFFSRNINAKLTNTQYVLLNLIEAPILAFILGYFGKFFSDNSSNEYLFSLNSNIPSYYFMSIIVALFIGLIVSAEEIFKDRKILIRESFLNLSRFSYLNSKIVTLLILSAIQALLFTIVGNYMLEIRGMFIYNWIIFYSCIFFANMVGLNISSALNSIVSIYIIIPLILVPQLLFSGLVIKFDKFHKDIVHEEYVPFIGDLMASRWAYEANMVAQFKCNRYNKQFYEADRKISNHAYYNFFLIPYLQNELTLIDNKSVEAEQKKLLLISNELVNASNFYSINPKSYKAISDSLISDNFNFETITKTSIYLEKLKKESLKNYLSSQKSKDELFIDLNKRIDILKLKKQYHNNSVEDIVLNKYAVSKIKNSNNRVIRLKDPIYYTGTNKYGRAHFFAPEKKLGKFTIDTFWFNTGVIWFMSCVLYLLLLGNVLKKTLDWFINFKNKDRYQYLRIINSNQTKKKKNAIRF